jgi:hypothetical protein
MRYSLLVAAAASAILLAACDSGSSSPGDDRRLHDEVESFSFPGTYTVDKKEHLLFMNKDVSGRDVCNFEDGKYSWKPLDKALLDDTVRYEFMGDTLVLEGVYGNITESYITEGYGAMYVGGKAGSLEGTWVDTHCEYAFDSKETECFDGNYKDISLEFSDGKYTKKITHHFGDYLNDVEESSYVDNFINSIYEALVGWYPDCYLPNIFSPHGNEDAENTIDKYGIKVIESSESSQTFTVRKKTYTFKVNQAEQSLSSKDDILMEINLEVSDGKKTCVGDYHLREVEKEQCSAEYEDDYMYDWYYVEGRLIKDRTLYLIENIEEFEKCLEGIAEDLPERNSDED